MSLRFVSEYIIILPIIIGLIVFKKAGLPYRLFVIFLLYGLITDIICSPELLSAQARFIVFNVFSLVESTFFTWFIMATSRDSLILKIGKFYIVAFTVFWFISHLKVFVYDLPKNNLRIIYNSTYLLLITVLSSYALLKFAEQHIRPYTKPLFWLLLSIFFNCFCVFFVKNFIQESFISQIWFVPNVINIVSYIMITIGFFQFNYQKGNDEKLNAPIDL